MAWNPTYRPEHARPAIRAAREAREELGIPLDTPLEDVLAAVEGVGLPVAVLDLGDGIAGAYVCRPKGRIVYVNRGQPVQRQRFTLAHELGHHRLDHPNNVDRLQDLTAFFAQAPVEVQANWFAAEFLMPMPAARRWAAEHLDGLATLEDVVRFACAFGVSAKAACIRLQNAGCIPDQQRCTRLHGEIDAGEHHDLAEGLDLCFLEDTLAAIKEDGARMPPQLAGSPLARYAAGDVDARTVAATVGRSPAEIRDIALDAGLPLRS